jgi:3-phenylpropionate/cinnamic acid dioxygenase small subunit
MKTEQRQEIEALLNKVLYCVDERDFSGMEACYTEDTKVVIRVDSIGLLEPMEGREALVELVKDRVTAQTDKRRHVLTNLQIEPEAEDRARTISYLTLLAVENGKAKVLTTGCYRDVVVCQDGSWLIAEREIELDAPY